MPVFDRQKAHRLLLELLELPPVERQAALDAACDDDALRAAVQRLLEAAEAPGSVVDPESEWTDSLWRDVAAEAAARQTPMAAGTRVGPYRILEEIERGGMAVVYRAERVDGELEREVAVKILKLGLDTEEVVRRFEQERQILADLDHPNIARLYDAGRTEDGRPYFVMELVEGLPVDRYCDEHRLSIDKRLELFCAVIDAVEYAHQNLVVHRDLKPSNILVNRSGEVKLLDFGIARLLDVEAAGAAAPPTRTLMRMMTPEYASPEQVRGERVTTASDVYQLGLLLYELLTGQRAYTISDRGPGELERVICEQPPTRPSAAVLRKEALRSKAFSARRSSPPRLRRRLRGDLDNIVLRALRKEPERRYRTADRLLQDIRRYCNGLPVTARADTWTYRGRKFLARHAVGATATALALIAAAGMAGFHTARIRNERDHAQAERNRAQAEATKAEQVSEFLTALFESTDPREARGAELTARELLDRGATRVDRELVDQPEVQAQMLQVLGRTYSELGLYDPAERLLTRTLELRRDRYEAGHPDIASTLADLGLLRYRRGEYEQAKALLERAARSIEASAKADASQHAAVLARLGHTYRRLREFDESIAVFERALRIQREVAGGDSLETAGILYGLGIVHIRTGRLERAEDLHGRAHAIYERELGADHPQVGQSLLDLASVRMERGEREGIEAMYRRALSVLENAYGPAHARVGMALNNLGHFLVMVGRGDEAIELLRRSFEIERTALGPDHPDVAYPLATLGDAHLAGSRMEEARDAYRRAVAVRRRAVDPSGFDPILFYSLVGLARTETELGNADATERSLQSALAVWKRAPRSTDVRLEPSLRYLGRWLAERQHCGEAVPLLRRAADLQVATQTLPDTRTAEIDTLLATCSESRLVTGEALN